MLWVSHKADVMCSAFPHKGSTISCCTSITKRALRSGGAVLRLIHPPLVAPAGRSTGLLAGAPGRDLSGVLRCVCAGSIITVQGTANPRAQWLFAPAHGDLSRPVLVRDTRERCL